MMKKICLIILLFFVSCIFITKCAYSEEDEWAKSLEIYNSDGLHRPVSAVEFEKTMKEFKKLKDRTDKSDKKRLIKKGEAYPEPSTKNVPVKVERKDIIKITNKLYYDGNTIAPGFYKINCSEENNNYYIKFSQGKNPVMKVKANKTSHMSFCPDKVNCLETEVYQDKYFKINFKTIDYAVSAYLAIVE